MVGGIHELSDAITNARKPVAVNVDGMLASAGVWAAAGADSISATRSSEIGSIGVYTVRVDRSQALQNAGIRVHLVSSGGVKGGADGGDQFVAAHESLVAFQELAVKEFSK
jgi:ClpP class serine protease